MRRLRKWVSRCAIALFALIGLLWLLGPYEPASLSTDFDASTLDQGVDAYLAWREAQSDGITAGAEKQVVWAGAPETQTKWSVVYLHGFSATSQEIRPVPDNVARALGANLVLTRLEGHGRDGDALAQATVAGWMFDTAEALAIARKTGQRVLVLSTSTGGTLAAAAALDPALMRGVAGIVLVSPNFAVNNPAARLLTWPAARYWVPLVAGPERSFEPLNRAQATYWTTRYPSTAVLPMAALVKAVGKADLGQANVPALFMLSDEDQVVDATATRAAMARWGGPVTQWHPNLTAADDPFAHVIAGDILSPSQTAPVSAFIVDWAKGLQ